MHQSFYYRENVKSLSAVMATLASRPMVLNQDEQRIGTAFVKLQLLQ